MLAIRRSEQGGRNARRSDGFESGLPRRFRLWSSVSTSLQCPARSEEQRWRRRAADGSRAEEEVRRGVTAEEANTGEINHEDSKGSKEEKAPGFRHQTSGQKENKKDRETSNVAKENA